MNTRSSSNDVCESAVMRSDWGSNRTTVEYMVLPVHEADNASAQACVPQKLSEEMQKEAEGNGSLRVWHEFSWWFPWYRVHFVSVYEGSDQFDQGISPIPFVGATLTCAPMFLNMLKALWSRVIFPIAGAVAGAEFTSLLASNAGIQGFIAAIILSLGTKGASLLTNWNSIDGLWSVFVGIIFSTVLGILRYGIVNLIGNFLKVIMGIANIAEVGPGNLYRIIGVPVNVSFATTILVRLHELGAVA